MGGFGLRDWRLRAWWNGRHARLRIWFRKDWRFKSSRAHHLPSPTTLPPPMIEPEGRLYIAHSGGKQSVEIQVVRLADLDRIKMPLATSPGKP